jgi:diguanylate cyclase (GGDEF)-like protein/PAS domain S-box-containing protein
MKLLIVDDTNTNLRLLRAQMESEGVTVVEAGNGVEALAMLADQQVDGIISDILMPQMDGYRLCLEVRRDPRYQHLPFVLYTSTYNSPADRSLAASAGADAYVEKPAPAEVLLSAIRRATERGVNPSTATAEEMHAPILRQYSETLIRKLEDKSEELARAYEGMVQIEARLSGLVQTAMDAIIAIDDSHTIILFNEAASRMFRCSSEDAIGRPLNSFIPARFRDAHTAHLRAFAAQPAARGHLGQRGVWALRADGSEFPVEASFSCMTTSQGRLFTAFLRDISERHQAEQALASSEAGLRRAQDLAHLAHVISAPDGTFLSWSPGMPALLGVAPEAAPRNTREWLDLLHPDDRRHYRETIIDRARSRAHAEIEFRIIRRGEWVDMRQVMEPLPDERDGAADGARWFNTLQDVTDQKQSERRLSRLNRVHSVLSAIKSVIVRGASREDLFRESCRIAVEAGKFQKAWIWAVDGAGSLLAAESPVPGFAAALQAALRADTAHGHDPLGATFRSGTALVIDDLRSSERIGPGLRGTIVHSRSLAALPIPGGNAVLVLASELPGYFNDEEMQLLRELANEISFALEHLTRAERIDYLANYDPLTGLANRSLFAERVEQRLSAGIGPDQALVVVLMDLDRLRRVNDTHGRDAGDGVLRQAAARLREINGSASRIGADLFAVLSVERNWAPDIARMVEATMAEWLGPPFLLAGQELRIGCRAGIATFPDDAGDAETLLRNAEAALRSAKEAKTGSAFYAPELNARAAEALAMESRLRRALDAEEFILHYQPKVNLGDGRICGLEALIRWQDPVGGLIPPGQFIPILEDMGLIGAVGRWALKRALRDHHTWRAAGLNPPRVAVNVSALQFSQPEFVGLIAELIAGDGEGALELELTESVLMADVERSMRMLQDIRALGVDLAIDDFGTGYCSLSYIAKLPVTALKIDRTFIQALSEGPEGVAIVSSILALAKAIKVRVVAEGVETEEQARLLRLLGCEEAQGFLFCRPVPAEAIPGLLAGPLPTSCL